MSEQVQGVFTRLLKGFQSKEREATDRQAACSTLLLEASADQSALGHSLRRAAARRRVVEAGAAEYRQGVAYNAAQRKFVQTGVERRGRGRGRGRVRGRGWPRPWPRRSVVLLCGAILRRVHLQVKIMPRLLVQAQSASPTAARPPASSRVVCGAALEGAVREVCACGKNRRGAAERRDGAGEERGRQGQREA